VGKEGGREVEGGGKGRGGGVVKFPKGTKPRISLHLPTQSVGATGGVYKGQGQSQCKLNDLQLQEIPRLRTIVAKLYPHHDASWMISTLSTDLVLPLSHP